MGYERLWDLRGYGMSEDMGWERVWDVPGQAGTALAYTVTECLRGNCGPK